jgi:hypothetical protein
MPGPSTPGQTQETIMARYDPARPPRTQIALRLLYTLAVLLALEICKALAWFGVIVQYVLLLATGKHSEPLRRFINAVSYYAYRCLRYAGLCENTKPFPFNTMPTTPDSPTDTIRFGK